MEKLRFNAKSLAVLLAVFFLGTSAAWANIIADGTVTDLRQGEPLIGVSVVEKGASNGVTTDIDGKFRINVADGATLTFSYVGYDPVEAMAAEAMSIVLKESTTMLDEVVGCRLRHTEKERRYCRYRKSRFRRTHGNSARAYGQRPERPCLGCNRHISSASPALLPECASAASALSTTPTLSTS